MIPVALFATTLIGALTTGHGDIAGWSALGLVAACLVAAARPSDQRSGDRPLAPRWTRCGRPHTRPAVEPRDAGPPRPARRGASPPTAHGPRPAQPREQRTGGHPTHGA